MKNKNFVLAIMLMICSVFMTACNDKVDKIRDYYVIEMETDVLFSSDNEGQLYLGAQYYGGKPVQLNAVKNTDENLMSTLDIYVRNEEGERELLLSSVSAEYQRQNWYLGVEGEFFVWSKGELKRLSKDGTEMFRRNVGGTVRDICQLSNGKVLLLLEDAESKKMKISEIAIETGEIDESKSIYLDGDNIQYISNHENALLLMNASGIYEVNLKDGSKTDVFPFVGTTFKLYESTVSDFCVTEEGATEILRGTTVQKLTRVNIAENRKILFVRDNGPFEIIEECIEKFNKENQEYYVVLEKRKDDATMEDIVNFKQQTNLQLASGEGADIIFQAAMSDAYALYEKGVFEDLRPYMEQSGIQEEDFFPITFEYLRDGEKIYTVHAFIEPLDTVLSEEFLGDSERPDIETLVKVLLNYREKAVLYDNRDSVELLDYFLCSSEDLWGMIDWENGSCDFSGELFAQILEITKRYGWSEQNDNPSLMTSRRLTRLYSYESYAQLESEGKVPVGYLFDDGGHVTCYSDDAVAINSNSPYKEGAWEFICYLLEEGQSMITWKNSTIYPVSREAFDKLIEHEIEEGSLVFRTVNGNSAVSYKGGGGTVYEELGYDDAVYKVLYDMTWERGDEIIKCMEDIRLRPTHTKPIITIVCEEAGAYFSGSKTIEDVVAVIENRVQLYLDENID